MFFKRQEGFRFAFDEPIEAKIKVVENNEMNHFSASILDISPHGIKIFSEKKVGEKNRQLPLLEISFILDATEIVGTGEIVWTKVFGTGYQYGVIFENQSSLEDLIVSELKARRKKEVAKEKVEKK